MNNRDSQNSVEQRWSKLEDLKYHFYLILYHDRMAGDGRKTKIFKHMNRFIPSRNTTKCRSHHQKKVPQYNQLLGVLARFYRENYIERDLDYIHLAAQLNRFIQLSFQSEAIDEAERYRLNMFVENNLQQLVKRLCQLGQDLHEQSQYHQLQTEAITKIIPEEQGSKKCDQNKKQVRLPAEEAILPISFQDNRFESEANYFFQDQNSFFAGGSSHLSLLSRTRKHNIRDKDSNESIYYGGD